MHKFNAEVEEVADEILAYALDRLRLEPPLDGPLTPQELYDKVYDRLMYNEFVEVEAGNVVVCPVQKACAVSQ